jgi:hypothetical protein
VKVGGIEASCSSDGGDDVEEAKDGGNGGDEPGCVDGCCGRFEDGT